MSTVEQAVNQSIEEFTQDLTDFSLEAEENAEGFKAELTADLRQWLRVRLPGIFTGGSSRMICQMPNNRHSFPSGNPKHCNNCGADFCTRHSLKQCVICGHNV